MLPPPAHRLRTTRSRSISSAVLHSAVVLGCALAALSGGRIIAREGVPFPEMLPWEASQPAVKQYTDQQTQPQAGAHALSELARQEEVAAGMPAQPVNIPAPPIAIPETEHCIDSNSLCEERWDWQLLPDGLIYRSYLAGFKESRFHSFWAYEEDQGLLWDIALGGRVGLVRFGSHDDARPEGWQFDLEGAAFPRLMPEEEGDLMSADFRAGAPLTFGIGPYQTKLAYYHLSSHLGDEFQLKNPAISRYNYSRDVVVLGQSYYLNDDLRIYGEAGWAFYSDVAGEWEFQFGIDYSPMIDNGFRGSPFAAINGHLREEVDFSGNLVVQAGWQWRSAESGHLARFGVEYYNGLADQFEFFNQHENKVGLALWYDY